MSNTMMKSSTQRAGRNWRVIIALIPGLLLWAAHPPADATDPNSGGGIGGTGISSYGAIQRFGSIYVNGSEYFLTDKTFYRKDGQPATLHDLRLGDVTLVQAQTNPAGRLTATSVHIRIALAGRIGQVNDHAGSFTLLGQVVQVTAETRTGGPGAPRLELAQLHAGDAVRISALARGKDRWVATRVVRGPAADFLLSATVRAIDRTQRRLTLGARTLATTGTLVGLSIGESVRATGRYLGGKPVVMRVQPLLAPAGGPGTKTEMSGYIEARPSATVLVVNGVRLRCTAQTRFIGGSAADAQPGTAIAVRGVTEPDGTVLANQMILRADPMRVGLPPAIAPRSDAYTRSGPREKPEIERPDIERPEIERPEVERPQIEVPEQPGR
ncbi:MAG: DUF5666 domain-containing protein [Acidiferrobacterales bacterium]